MSVWVGELGGWERMRVRMKRVQSTSLILTHPHPHRHPIIPSPAPATTFTRAPSAVDRVVHRLLRDNKGKYLHTKRMQKPTTLHQKGSRRYDFLSMKSDNPGSHGFGKTRLNAQESWKKTPINAFCSVF